MKGDAKKIMEEILNRIEKDGLPSEIIVDIDGECKTIKLQYSLNEIIAMIVAGSMLFCKNMETDKEDRVRIGALSLGRLLGELGIHMENWKTVRKNSPEELVLEAIAQIILECCTLAFTNPSGLIELSRFLLKERVSDIIGSFIKKEFPEEAQEPEKPVKVRRGDPNSKLN